MANMNPVAKMAKLLKAPQKVILALEKKMSRITGKKGVIDKIIQAHDKNVEEKLQKLNLKSVSGAEEVYSALIQKTKECNHVLFEHFHKPDLSTQTGCYALTHAVKELTGGLTGFYLKKEKAQDLFRKNPPKQIMGSLGYGSDIEKMLEKEDIFELFCALRFVEKKDWLNEMFFKAYSDLTKDDFEERKIEVIVLPERWAGIGQKFLGKKLHCMSHLKELGFIFVIPTVGLNSREIIYLFFMTLHYSYEVDWYSQLFKKYSQKKDFVKKMTNALKVGTTGESLPDKDKASWRIIPAYLGKNDPNDPRLTEPHINPEALFYSRTALAIEKFAKRFPKTGFDFWQDSDDLAGYFLLAESEEEALISFDLFDNGISFLRRDVFENRRVYHQHEALWNRIFVEYMGEEMLDKIMIENLDKGYVML